jgi:hypothetical protein
MNMDMKEILNYIKKIDKVVVGKLHFNVDMENKELHISNVYIKLVDKPSIKLFKIFLLRLIYTFENSVETITINASPNKRRTEFCLIYYYQTLGFEPINYDCKNYGK